MADRDPYAVLGVPVHADLDTIAAAYRTKARRHHPDVSVDPNAERLMAEINDAWATLRDPERRAAWDRGHLRVQPDRPSTFDPHAQPRRRGTPPMAPPVEQTPVRRPTGAAPGVPEWRLGPNGEGAAGPPPGPRRGSVLPFGRHIGWSLGEIQRSDPGYLMWVKDRPEGAPFKAEIERMMAGATPGGTGGSQPQAQAEKRRRGLFG